MVFSTYEHEQGLSAHAQQQGLNAHGEQQGLCAYEQKRQQNIERNDKVLRILGIEPLFSSPINKKQKRRGKQPKAPSEPGPITRASGTAIPCPPTCSSPPELPIARQRHQQEGDPLTIHQKMAYARSKKGKKTRNISQASTLMRGHKATKIREAALKASAAGSLLLPSPTAALKHTTLQNATQIPIVRRRH